MVRWWALHSLWPEEFRTDKMDEVQGTMNEHDTIIVCVCVCVCVCVGWVWLAFTLKSPTSVNFPAETLLYLKTS